MACNLASHVILYKPYLAYLPKYLVTILAYTYTVALSTEIVLALAFALAFFGIHIFA
jgi:hypothetical protein